jgi:Domain of Unknown Function (DUF1080)
MKLPKFFFHASTFAILCASPVLAQDGWVNLFNGKNLDGWELHSGTAKYSAVDGVLVGESVAGTGNSFLCPVKSYGNFELELDYQVDDQLNSGVQFRSDLFPEARTLQFGGVSSKLPADRLHGYQCEIDMDTKKNRMWTAGIYDEARRGWLFPGKLGGSTNGFTEQGRRISKPGEWNHLRILCNGASIKTWLNGEPRADICDAAKMPPKSDCTLASKTSASAKSPSPQTRFPPTSKKLAGNCSGTANPTKAGAARSRKISPPRAG